MKQGEHGQTRQRLRVLAGILVSVLLLWFVLQKVDLRETVRTFVSADYPYLIMAGLISACAFILTAMRWRYVLLPLQPIAPGLLFSTVMAGFFSNYVLPAKVGELVRVILLVRHTKLSGSAIVATIVLERAMDVLILTVALLGVLLVLPLPAWMGYVGQVAGLALGGVFVVLAILLYRPQGAIAIATRLLRPISTRLADGIAATLEAFVRGLEVLRQGNNLGRAMFFSLLSWVSSASTHYLVGLALGVRTNWAAYVLLVALFNLIAIIPSMPGRIGTWELVSVAALGLFGVDGGTAVAFPTLLRIAHLLPLALGYFYFSREGLRLLDVLGGRKGALSSPREELGFKR